MDESDKKKLEQEWVDAGAPFGVSPKDMIDSMIIFMDSRDILIDTVQKLSDNCHGNLCMIGIATLIAQALFLAELDDSKYLEEAVETMKQLSMRAFNESSSASEQFSAMIAINLGNKGGV